MVTIIGDANISFTNDELDMLLYMVEDSLYGAMEEGEPSEAARTVWRKVAMLKALDEASCQRGAARGGDSGVWQAMECERRKLEQQTAEYNRPPLDGGWGQS